MALAQLNRPGEAIPHLEKALELDTDGSLYYQLGHAYQVTGKADQARAAMQKYQQIQKLNREQTDELNKEAQITAPEKTAP
jgi:Flp pilus assembly protein TadD